MSIMESDVMDGPTKTVLSTLKDSICPFVLMISLTHKNFGHRALYIRYFIFLAFHAYVECKTKSICYVSHNFIVGCSLSPRWNQTWVSNLVWMPTLVFSASKPLAKYFLYLSIVS
jgi:hypothetical protein